MSDASALRATDADTPSARPTDTSLALLDTLVSEVERVFLGKEEVVRLALAALIARGHVLFEDVPGVGKTTLARALARVLGLGFRRIQFTSDLLPSDLLGVSIYNPQSREFEIRTGPIFTQVVLADEINRAPPRTQSGLLQAMEEGQVSIDDHALALPRPFLVLATQNPLEHHGTYPLPESQLDRFLMRLTIGYPNADAERRILLESRGGNPPIDELEARVGPAEVIKLQERVDEVHADPSIVDYIMEIVQRTRDAPSIRLGASPRGAVALLRASRALALTRGRAFIVPDDVRDLAVPCLAHRLLPAGASSSTADAHETAAALLTTIVSEVEAPV
ncbi:MAG: MoxR family ATPase [Longimicrobiales bacterium]|nr:MoxR family ATPase [Longimicrobiales bacterium]